MHDQENKQYKRVAILVPTYNSANTIDVTLKSLQEQNDSLKYISAIYVADDFSEDGTLGMVAAWRTKLPLNILKNEKNLGERGNVNQAIENIQDTTDWVLLLHSDDIAKSNWLKTMLIRIENCSDEVASICSSWDNLLEDGTIEVGEDNAERAIELIQGTSSAVRNTLFKGCWWHISGCAIRLQAFEEIGAFVSDMPQQGDWEWLLRCLSKGWAIEYIPRTLILYRQHSASVSSISYRTHRDIQESLRILRQYQKFLSFSDYFSLHLTKAGYLLRRIARSILKLNIERFLLGWLILFSLIWNFLIFLPLNAKSANKV